ncbi:MAG: PQQ-binding-like beta-propeller repeat protein, partial [Bryobacteraceae bacterium]
MNKMRSIWIGLACCGFLCGADWLTDGGNQKRTAWQQDEHILSKDNVKDLKILWKIQLDNQPRDMHALFAPLIADKVATSQGPKQIAIEAGA